MSLIDYLLIAVIAALAAADIWYLRRKRKSCGGCSSCPYAGGCPKARALSSDKTHGGRRRS